MGLQMPSDAIFHLDRLLLEPASALNAENPDFIMLYAMTQEPIPKPPFSQDFSDPKG